MFNHFKPTPKAPDAVAPRRYVRYNCGSGSVIAHAEAAAVEESPLPEITAIEIIESGIRDTITVVSALESEAGTHLIAVKSYVIPICLTNTKFWVKRKKHRHDHHFIPDILATFSTTRDITVPTTFVRCRGGPMLFDH